MFNGEAPPPKEEREERDPSPEMKMKVVTQHPDDDKMV